MEPSFFQMRCRQRSAAAKRADSCNAIDFGCTTSLQVYHRKEEGKCKADDKYIVPEQFTNLRVILDKANLRVIASPASKLQCGLSRR